MLVITDRSGDRVRADRWTGCTVVGLGTPSAPQPPFAAIVCDVALDDLSTIAAVRGALAVYRASSDVPVHFVLRDRSIVAHAIANALGATTLAVEEPAVAVVGAIASPPAEASAQRGPTPEEEIDSAAESLSRIFGAAIARAPLDPRDLDEGVAALLHSTKEAGIGRWVEIVRRHDDATYQHCLLVAGLTAAFAVQLGFSLGRQRMLVQAALLHDIGKARVPLATLNKAGPLTPAEQAVMRKHPSDGYYMLVKQGGLERGVLDVVLQHHEMLDGTGYPAGLRRDQISDVVRIVTICDIHAALIEKRPYRRPMAADAAYAVLLGMGAKLDATLVAAFGGIVVAMRDANETEASRAIG